MYSYILTIKLLIKKIDLRVLIRIILVIQLADKLLSSGLIEEVKKCIISLNKEGKKYSYNIKLKKYIITINNKVVEDKTRLAFEELGIMKFIKSISQRIYQKGGIKRLY